MPVTTATRGACRCRRGQGMVAVAAQRRPRTAQGDPLQDRKAALRGTRCRGRGGSNGSGGSNSNAPKPAKRWGFANPTQQQLLQRSETDGERWREDASDAASGDAVDELSDFEVAELLGQDTAPADALAGSDPAIEAELGRLLAKFSFEFDPFQVAAVRHLLAGRSVVVCAPTGAGKTAIAEAATHHFVARGQRVIYTTPLKALSNQKLGEMRKRFGVGAAGLQTGDASINVEGEVVVMTTEILRNMLYRSEERGTEEDDRDTDAERPDGGQAAGTAAAAAGLGGQQQPGGPQSRRGSTEERLAGVGLVVLDETHYLGDPSRGSVWEETIINLPSHIRILAMSATVRNPEDLSGWISAVHGTCDTVTTTFRPVPLKWQYALSPGDASARLLPLLTESGRGLNPALLPPSRRLEDGAGSDEDESWGRWDSLSEGRGRGGASGAKAMSVRTLEELVGGLAEDGGWHQVPRWKRVPAIDSVVAELATEGMLPAIWFIFSRKECDAAAARLHTSGMQLTTVQERQAILSEVAAMRADQAEAVKEDSVAALASGLASHHAGCLPAWKALVERLFQRGLVKVVFATETLAAGINMPARTTLLSALSRRRDGGIAALTHNEMLQMAGRAGRRGFDSLGHCVIVQSRWEGPEFAWDIMRRGPEPLRSQFATSYGMALNLLWSRSLAEAKEFLDRSFSRYLGGAGSRRVLAEVERLEGRAKGIMEEAVRRAGAAAARRGSPAAGSGSGGRGFSGAGGLLGGAQREEGDEGEAADCDAPPAAGEGDDGVAARESSSGADRDYEDVWSRYEKLQGRRREEKRAARLLRSQLADERAAAADAALLELGLPRAVGLDLSGTNIDDSSYRLPALAVARLDLADSAAPAPVAALAACFEAGCYLCLGADNTLLLVGSRNLAAAADFDTPGAEDAARAVLRYAQGLGRGGWSPLSGEVSTAAGSALTAAAVLQLPSADQLTALTPPPEGLEALALQRERVAAVKAELAGVRADKHFARASRRYAQAASKAGVMLDRAAMLRVELQGKLDGGWRAFEDIVGVLEAAGAFRAAAPPPPGDGSGASASASGGGGMAQRRRFAPLGLVAREVRGANELWLAVALTHAALQALPPPQLAAVLSAIVAPEAYHRSSVYVAYDPSPPVTAAVEALEPARAELAALQLTAKLDAPLAVDLRMSGVVEAWASGASWSEVTKDCGLDDGDVARLLMRTVDVLRQAAFCEHLLPGLRGAARAAARAMDRKPISDLIT